jgi:hypothetical protein
LPNVLGLSLPEAPPSVVRLDFLCCGSSSSRCAPIRPCRAALRAATFVVCLHPSCATGSSSVFSRGAPRLSCFGFSRCGAAVREVGFSAAAFRTGFLRSTPPGRVLSISRSVRSRFSAAAVFCSRWFLRRCRVSVLGVFGRAGCLTGSVSPVGALSRAKILRRRVLEASWLTVCCTSARVSVQVDPSPFSKADSLSIANQSWAR